MYIGKRNFHTLNVAVNLPKHLEHAYYHIV